MTQMKKKQHLQVDLEILAIKKIRHNGKEYNFTDALVNTYCYLKGWKEAFPSYNKIADVFAITRDAAKERVRSLEAMGLVEKIERSGQSNFYIVKEIDLSNVKGRSYSENKGTRHEIKEQETEAVTETSPQEPQQPETNPALPSSDDIHTPADSLSDDVPKPTGNVNLIFKPYNPEEEEDENYGEDEEEEEEFADWERVDESPPSKIKPSSISLAMRNQLYPQRKSEKGDYTEHIPF